MTLTLGATIIINDYIKLLQIASYSPTRNSSNKNRKKPSGQQLALLTSVHQPVLGVYGSMYSVYFELMIVEKFYKRRCAWNHDRFLALYNTEN